MNATHPRRPNDRPPLGPPPQPAKLPPRPPKGVPPANHPPAPIREIVNRIRNHGGSLTAA